MVKTYNEYYMEARRALRTAGVEAAALEARLLLAAAAEKDPAAFLRDIRLYPTDDFIRRAEDFLRRRLAGEPAAYIAGCWEFFGLELEISPRVLIPRSDTEVVVQAALDALTEREKPRILDLCTGSGCIGLALAARRPDSRALLADIDPHALAVARRNAARHGLSGRVSCVQADALAEPARQLGSFDLLISNPPYIADAEMDTLDASVRDYEPRLALRGGADGLDFYRAIFARWATLLRPGGCLALECGEGQSGALRRLGRETGLAELGAYPDSQGTLRAVLFTNPDTDGANDCTADRE